MTEYVTWRLILTPTGEVLRVVYSEESASIHKKALEMIYGENSIKVERKEPL